MTWLLRLVLPFLPLLIAGGLGIGGLGLNAWLGITDWKTAIILAVAITAIAFIAQSQSPWSRLLVTAVIAVAMYIKGGIDRDARHELAIAALKETHKVEIVSLHEAYKLQSNIEEARQLEANRKALEAAAAEKVQADAELAAVQQDIDRLRGEAQKDVHAKRPSLSIDAVRRLNIIRGYGVRPGS